LASTSSNRLLGKFLSPDKVLIGRVPETDDRYADYEAVAAAFAAATCAWGTPYRVYRVDTPGSSPYTPYTNSLILNGKVYVPLTGHTLDAAAIAAYRQAMPGYEVLGYAYSGWLNTDALHCRCTSCPTSVAGAEAHAAHWYAARAGLPVYSARVRATAAPHCLPTPVRALARAAGHPVGHLPLEQTAADALPCGCRPCWPRPRCNTG
jgi:hypothetical protein